MLFSQLRHVADLPADAREPAPRNLGPRGEAGPRVAPEALQVVRPLLLGVPLRHLHGHW